MLSSNYCSPLKTPCLLKTCSMHFPAPRPRAVPIASFQVLGHCDPGNPWCPLSGNSFPWLLQYMLSDLTSVTPLISVTNSVSCRAAAMLDHLVAVLPRDLTPAVPLAHWPCMELPGVAERKTVCGHLQTLLCWSGKGPGYRCISQVLQVPCAVS